NYEKILSLLKNKTFKPGTITLEKGLDVKTMIELSRCYFLKGNQEKEGELLKKAQKLSPKNPEVLLYLGKYYLLNNDLELAIESFINNPVSNFSAANENTLSLTDNPVQN